MTSEVDLYSSSYDKLLKDERKSNKNFALIVNVSAAFLECKNIALHTTEQASRMENLIVNLVSVLKRTTRTELYLLTGRAPELIDKDLEKMRSQGYLEYVVPYENKALHENIKRIKKEIGLDLIVEEKLNSLMASSPLKQYYLTDLGLKLYETGFKDSLEEGDVDFIFLRNGNEWNSISHIVDSKKKKRYYNMINVTEFSFFEPFLKRYSKELSQIKVFRELTPFSMIGLDEISDSKLWMIHPSKKLILQTNSSYEAVSTIKNYPLEVDYETIKLKLNDMGIAPELISSRIPVEAPSGCSLCVKINSIDELHLVFQALEFDFNNYWTKNLLVEEQEALIFFRVLLLPTNKEILNAMVVERIKSKYPEGIIKRRSTWNKEISEYVQALEKMSKKKGSVGEIIDKIDEIANYWIAERLVENDIKNYFKKDIKELNIEEIKSQIVASCILSASRFRSEFKKISKDSVNTLEDIPKIVETGEQKFSYKLHLYSNNEKETLIAYFILLFRNEVIRKKDLSSKFKELIKSLKTRKDFKSIPSAEEMNTIAKEAYKTEILIAEELVEKYLKTFNLSQLIKTYDIDSDKDQVEAKIIIDEKALAGIYENTKLKIADYSTIFEEKSTLNADQGVSFSVIPRVISEEGAEKILTLRLSSRLNNRLTTLLKLKGLIESNLSSIYAVSDIEKAVIIDENKLNTFIAEIRKFSNFYIEEEEITKELFKSNKSKDYISNIHFRYAKNKVSRVEIEFKKELLTKVSLKYLKHILDHDKKIELKIAEFNIKFKVFAYPEDEGASIEFLQLKIHDTVTNQLWKFSQLKDFVSKEAQKQQNTAKSFGIDKKRMFSKRAVSHVVKNYQKNNRIVLEDIIFEDIKNNYNLSRIEFEDENELIMARVQVNLKETKELWKQHSYLFVTDVVLERKLDDKHYSYTIQLIPEDSETAYQLSLLITANEIVKLPMDNVNIVRKFSEYYEHYLPKNAVSISHDDSDNLIDNIRNESGLRIIVNEEEIEKEILDYFNSYNNYNLLPNSAEILITRRNIKNFETKVDRRISPKIHLKSKEIGDFEVVIVVHDRAAFTRILELSLRHLDNENKQENAEKLFDKYLDNTKISENEKQKIKEKKLSIVKRVLKNLEKNK